MRMTAMSRLKMSSVVFHFAFLHLAHDPTAWLLYSVLGPGGMVTTGLDWNWHTTT